MNFGKNIYLCGGDEYDVAINNIKELTKKYIVAENAPARFVRLFIDVSSHVVIYVESAAMGRARMPQDRFKI